MNAKEAFKVIYSNDYVYHPRLKEALETIAEKSNGAPFYIYHTISELSKKGLPFDLATVRDLPKGVENLLIDTLHTGFVFKGKGREGNKSFLKLLICLSMLERDFSVYLYELLYEELRGEFDIRKRVDAFKSFLSEGESVYELMLTSYWRDAIRKALKRDTEDERLADEFGRAEAELDPKIIGLVLKRKLEEGSINKRYFHLIADAAKLGRLDYDLLDYAYEKYKAVESIESEGKDYAEFVLIREYLLRGYAFNAIRQFESAIRNFDKALKLEPEENKAKATAYRNRGVAYSRLTRYEEAIKDFDRAIVLKPEYVDAYTVRGDAYAKLGRYEEALRDFNKAIELDPEYAVAHDARGCFYLDLEQYDEAISDFTTAIALDPDYAEAYLHRGSAYWGLEQYEGVLNDFNKAIELDPESALAYTARGGLYSDLEKFDETIRDYSAAIELKKEDPQTYLLRGEAYAELEQYEEAVKDFEKALKLNPGSITPYLDSLFHIVAKALEIDPDYAVAYRLRGGVYAELEQYEEAIRDYNTAIELNPEDAMAYQSRSRAYAKLEEKDEMHNPKSEVVEKATERDAIEPTSIRPPQSDLKILLGEDENKEEIFWEPKKEINWSFVIVGSAGTGKTQTVKAVLSEFAKCGLPYIIFDFRNDYISKAKESEFGRILDLSKISINPLELDGNNTPKDQKYQVSSIIGLVYNIGDRQVGHIRSAIKDSYENKGIKESDEDSWNKTPPTFDDIKNNLERRSEEGNSGTKSSIEGIFARLDPIFDYGIFSAETVMPFGEIMKGQTIVNLGTLPDEELKAVVCEFFMRKLRYHLDTIGESREPRLYVIIDEAHRLKYEREASAGQLLKEARKYGVGLLLATQDPVDFTDVVYNNIGGIMSLQLTDPKYAKTIAEHLGGKVKWQNVKNDLSAKFAAYVKFSQKPDAIKFEVIPHYER
ncbi:hypothetical protein C5S30_05820 [ANME-1 cluster archaeon GoMg4]|nr:hypothetical protein [ANME-1 cluster archaeon GoMg4]